MNPDFICLFVQKNHFSFYEFTNDSGSPAWTLIHIKDEPTIQWNPSKFTESDLNEAISNLCSEKNRVDGSLSSFVLIENADSNVNARFKNALKDKFKGAIPLKILMKEALNRLQKAPSGRTDLGGINFDGRNYTISNGHVVEAPFNLLGYTISQDELMRYLNTAVQLSGKTN